MIKYTEIEQIGSGKNGSKVFKVRDNNNLGKEQYYAKKTNKVDLSEGAKESVERQMSYDHPNIVKIIKIEEEKEKEEEEEEERNTRNNLTTITIIMELAKSNLREFILKEKELPKEKPIKMMLMICEGVREIHKERIPQVIFNMDNEDVREIHRENLSKPHLNLNMENILVFEEDIIKITDFGIIQENNHQTSYLSPEILSHRNLRDTPSDIWALGCIFYELCTNKTLTGYTEGQEIDLVSLEDEVKRPNIDKVLDELKGIQGIKGINKMSEYIEIKEIHRGNVWKVEHKITKEIYALKRITVDEHTIKKKKRETELPKIHRNIIKIIVVEENLEGTNEWLNIIMEWSEEGDLAKYMKNIYNNGEWFSESEIIRMMLEISEGLRCLHEQEEPIVHLDIKPANILLFGDTLKIADFGAAKRIENLRQTTYAEEITEAYAAPEIINAVRDATRRVQADIWSLGCLFYELCTNKIAYPKNYHQGISPDMNLLKPYSQQITQLISQSMLVKEWEKRDKINVIIENLQIIQKANRVQQKEFTPLFMNFEQNLEKNHNNIKKTTYGLWLLIFILFASLTANIVIFIKYFSATKDSDEEETFELREIKYKCSEIEDHEQKVKSLGTKIQQYQKLIDTSKDSIENRNFIDKINNLWNEIYALNSTNYQLKIKLNSENQYLHKKLTIIEDNFYKVESNLVTQNSRQKSELISIYQDELKKKEVIEEFNDTLASHIKRPTYILGNNHDNLLTKLYIISAKYREFFTVPNCCIRLFAFSNTGVIEINDHFEGIGTKEKLFQYNYHSFAKGTTNSYGFHLISNGYLYNLRQMTKNPIFVENTTYSEDPENVIQGNYTTCIFLSDFEALCGEMFGHEGKIDKFEFDYPFKKVKNITNFATIDSAKGGYYSMLKTTRGYIIAGNSNGKAYILDSQGNLLPTIQGSDEYVMDIIEIKPDIIITVGFTNSYIHNISKIENIVSEKITNATSKSIYTVEALQQGGGTYFMLGGGDNIQGILQKYEFHSNNSITLIKEWKGEKDRHCLYGAIYEVEVGKLLIGGTENCKHVCIWEYISDNEPFCFASPTNSNINIFSIANINICEYGVRE